jgi:hypothetical protein
MKPSVTATATSSTICFTMWNSFAFIPTKYKEGGRKNHFVSNE